MSNTQIPNPVRDNLVLKVIEQDTTTAGGIALPTSAFDKPYMGKVIAANKEFVMPDGSIKDAECEAGDIVYFGKSHGTEIKFKGEQYLVISEEFILCKE